MSETTWWFRRPWWSIETYGQLIVSVVSFVLIFSLLVFGDEWTFRIIVSGYVAGKLAENITRSIRDTPH